MTNAAAIGYAIMAAKAMGLGRDALKALESHMYYMMDEATEEEAEEVYRNN